MMFTFFFQVIPQGRKKNSSSWRSNYDKIHILLNITFKLGSDWEITVKLFLSDLFEIALDTNGSQLPRVISGKAGVCISCHHSVTWPKRLLALGRSNGDSEMHLPDPLQDISSGFDLGKRELRRLTTPLCTSWDGLLTCPSKQMGVLFTGNLLGCQTRRSFLPHDDDPARIPAGVSPPLPRYSRYLHPREMKWRISLLALAGLLENPGLHQEACLWYSYLSRKYYRCHFIAPKLLTRQHSYLIRHSTAIHIYLYLNSCPLYYTAGHASAPTPPY